MKVTKENLQNQWWRLNNMYRVLDARMNDVLFVPNAAQKFLYHNLWFLNIILKARQLGFSTFIDIWGFDTAFWNPNQRVVIIAQDKDAAEKLFEEKIKYPYDQLDESVKSLNPKLRSNAREMKFANNSSVRVVTSARSGTVNFLHISEFGKICAKDPQKAREVVTGTLNAVAPGELVFIESTAEGREGAFYRMTQKAIKLFQLGKPLNEMDYKFHFFPWYEEPRYRLDPEYVVITKGMRQYFDELETQIKVKIDEWQRAWYVTKADEQGEDMKREYPSTPKEAFEQAIIGAYFSSEMALVRKQKRIRPIPYEPKLPVYTFWDLGRDDSMSIWFMQYHRAGDEYRFINYMEGEGESLQYYLKEIRKLPYVYETMYFPHDADIVDLTSEENLSRADIARGLGFKIIVVPRVDLKNNAIQAVRDILHKCWFDEENAEQGIKCLDHRRKEWDDKRGCFRDKPLHDWSSHGGDSFEQFARGFNPQNIMLQSESSNTFEEYDNSYVG